MRTATLCFTLCLLCFGQVRLQAQTVQDSLAVRQACLDYVEGWATADLARIERGVSPEMVKRTIGKDKDGLCFTVNMSRTQLVYAGKMNKEGIRMPDQDPGKPYSPDIKIFDITGDYALVKVISGKYGFFDYCQLAKFNGEWKIINVLWGMVPPKK